MSLPSPKEFYERFKDDSEEARSSAVKLGRELGNVLLGRLEDQGDDLETVAALLNEFQRTVQGEPTAKVEGDKVVINHVTGLMWQQAAADFVPGAEIQNHIKSVNADRYAGFSDWRLPTIEELMSLVEGPEKGADFIDPIFELPLWFCASADKEKGEDNSVWVVSFEDGYVKDHLATDELYVLLVRSAR